MMDMMDGRNQGHVVASMEMCAAGPSLFHLPQWHLRCLSGGDHVVSSCDIGIKRTESKIANLGIGYVSG
jgi:CYTH domain-containing protein